MNPAASASNSSDVNAVIGVRESGAPVFDPIECCRGQMAALSYLSPASAREVHILSIRKAFERVDREADLRYALTVLNLMREVQELSNGFWFPTPLRAVSLGSQAMLIGISPTQELVRHFPSVRKAGFARLACTSELTSLPQQPLAGWTMAESDSVAWTRNHILAATKQLGPTLTSESVEVFGTAQRTVSGRLVTLPEWKATTAKSGIASVSNLVICRERIGRQRHRYFFGRLHSGRVEAESALPRDIIRLQFGFAHLVGAPLSVVQRRTGKSRQFVLFNALPLGERRLLFALGRREPSRQGKKYEVIGDENARHIEQHFRHLGCDVKDING